MTSTPIANLLCRSKRKPGSRGSDQPSIGEAADAIADDDVIEDADIDQVQRLAQALGNADVGLARLADARRVVVGLNRLKDYN